MSAEKLAFLQNFYTDVTLYVPAEPTELVVEPTAVEPMAVEPPAMEAPPAASAASTVTDVSLSGQTARTSTQVSRSFSHPTAGLERLATGYRSPPMETPAAPAPLAAPARVAAPPALAAAEPVAPVAPAVPPVMLTQFTTLGSNAQGVVLLFRVPAEQFIKLHRNVFLNKMLQALSLVMADVVLVNVESDLPVALVNLRRELAATHVVAFGKNLLDATIRNTQIYEPVQFPNLGLSYLASATVDLVEYDVSLKKRLWPGLQRMFLG